MAKFNYKMQNILNIKLRLETQAKTEFAEASARLSQEEDKMRQLIFRKRQYEQDAKGLVADRLSIIDIKHCSASIKTMQEMITQQAVVVRLAEKNLERSRIKLNEAMQDRKIHEKLREKAFEEFKIELNDEEKKEIDELVSFTYNNGDKNADE